MTPVMKTRAAANEESERLFSGQTVTLSSPTEAWHTLSVEETARRLRTNVTHGLTRAEATLRYTQQGSNALAGVKQRSLSTRPSIHLAPVVGAILMSASTMVVATNAQLLRCVKP